MEVVNPRAALLSNYEVLNLLRELESDHLSSTKAALRVKKEPEVQASSSTACNNLLEAGQNLRTVEVEAISYLSADYLPTAAQSDEGISKLVRDLAPYELTKAEKLQIVNLAPTLAVELYVIVEELEDRFGDQIEDILSHVQASLAPPTQVPMTNGTHHAAPPSPSAIIVEGDAWDEDADAVYEEYDDTGEGAGVQGDLEEMEED